MTQISVAVLFLSVSLISPIMGIMPIPFTNDIEPSEIPARIEASTIINFVASPSRVYVGDEVTFYANASSDVSSSLTFTIFYDARLANSTNNTQSPYSVNNTVNPGSIVTKFTYDHIGNLSYTQGTCFQAKLYVGDGTNTVSETILVYVVENAPPSFTRRLPTGMTADPGVPVNLSVGVEDVDDDELTVTWDFGDGSPVATNSTGPAASGVYANQTHTWDPDVAPGWNEADPIYYWLTVTVEDSEGHMISSLTNVTINLPYNFVPNITLVSSKNESSPMSEVTFYASALDLEGEALTWTFTFNNSVSIYHTEVYHTDVAPPGTNLSLNITHTFEEVGNYTVTLYVSDALIPDQIFPHNISVRAKVTVTLNYAPLAMMVISYTAPTLILDDVNTTVNVTFTARANDVDGDVMTAVWDFGDSSDTVTQQSSGGTAPFAFIQSHGYNKSGIYNVTVVITDGRDGHEVTRYLLLMINSTNQAPSIVSFALGMSERTYALPGSVVTFTFKIHDNEMDPIDLYWDFDDNSSIMHIQTTDYDSSGNVTITVNYTYDLSNEYHPMVWITDNQIGIGFHNISYTMRVVVSNFAPRADRVWDEWDYVGLLILFGSIGGLALRALILGRYRKWLDQHGMTLDEYRLRMKDLKTSYRKARASAKDDGARSALKEKYVSDKAALRNMLRRRTDIPREAMRTEVSRGDR